MRVFAHCRPSSPVIVGRSNNVGKSAAILGLPRNATVIFAHKHTSDADRPADHALRADTLIMAGPDHRRHDPRGAIVVDIGIDPVEGPDGAAAVRAPREAYSGPPRVSAA